MDKQDLPASGRSVSPWPEPCPQCDAQAVTTSWVLDTFEHHSRNSVAEIEVYLPVRRCGSCGFGFVDHEGEDLKHEAVCRHLGVLTPKEIREIRRRFDMNRAEFAAATKLSEASLHRWENGLLIQNEAYDMYLRLLREEPMVMRCVLRLGGRGSRADLGPEVTGTGPAPPNTPEVGTFPFRVPDVLSRDMQAIAAEWSLRLYA